MPENTAMPMAWRISAPAPCATTSGNTPAMNAMLVIKMGRKRSRQAAMAASKGLSPSSCLRLANSTMRIAFLQARPTSTIKPIWVKMLLSPPLSQTPAMAHSRHMGTIRMMAMGSRKLS